MTDVLTRDLVVAPGKARTKEEAIREAGELLVGCGALFGLPFVLVRMVVGAFGPVGTAIIRTLVGGTALLAVAVLRGQAAHLRTWPQLFGLAVLHRRVRRSRAGRPSGTDRGGGRG